MVGAQPAAAASASACCCAHRVQPILHAAAIAVDDAAVSMPPAHLGLAQIAGCLPLPQPNEELEGMCAL